MSDRPLVLLLDDKAEARESMRALFEAIECSVIAVATHESALAEISSRTDIDFVVTDLNLKADSTDKSGIVFAKMVRQLRADIPMAAYSAKTKDIFLSPNDYRVFDLFLDKSSGNADEIMRYVNECKSLALIHKKMAVGVREKLVPVSDQQIKEIENRITRIESDYLKLPNIGPYARAIYITIGVAGAVASMVALYLVVR